MRVLLRDGAQGDVAVVSLVFDGGEATIVMAASMAAPGCRCWLESWAGPGRSCLEPDRRRLGCGGRQIVLIIIGHHLSWGSDNDKQHWQEHKTIEDTKDDQGQQDQEEIPTDRGG